MIYAGLLEIPVLHIYKLADFPKTSLSPLCHLAVSKLFADTVSNQSATSTGARSMAHPSLLTMLQAVAGVSPIPGLKQAVDLVLQITMIVQVRILKVDSIIDVRGSCGCCD